MSAPQPETSTKPDNRLIRKDKFTHFRLESTTLAAAPASQKKKQPIGGSVVRMAHLRKPVLVCGPGRHCGNNKRAAKGEGLPDWVRGEHTWVTTVKPERREEVQL